MKVHKQDLTLSRKTFYASPHGALPSWAYRIDECHPMIHTVHDSIHDLLRRRYNLGDDEGAVRGFVTFRVLPALPFGEGESDAVLQTFDAEIHDTPLNPLDLDELSSKLSATHGSCDSCGDCLAISRRYSGSASCGMSTSYVQACPVFRSGFCTTLSLKNVSLLYRDIIPPDYAGQRDLAMLSLPFDAGPTWSFQNGLS